MPLAGSLHMHGSFRFWLYSKIQNSVFEGEISEAKLERLKTELRRTINLEEDSVIIYTFRTEWYSKREIIGLDKGGQVKFL
uniref:CRISPR-associated endonuclease Cas2 n=1 Tax=candidate division WOR-3 bacterium TaxID=2052148 RepID=A0A7V4E1B2_UNCW3